jgi:hypothetical protein
MCAEMMKDGATPAGQNAMREFMKSERAPEAMANMMEMARRMGNGDVMRRHDADDGDDGFRRLHIRRSERKHASSR